MIKYNKIFLNIDYDIHYHSAKSQIIIQLVYGETKRINCILGYVEPNSIV